MTSKDDALARREKRLADALKANLRRRKATAAATDPAQPSEARADLSGDPING